MLAHSQIEYYRKGDTLTVLAKNGLILREDHRVASNKIMQLKFGDKVQVIDYLFFGDYIDGSHGSWIHVKAKSKTGYMFSGYLTQLKLPSIFDLLPNCSSYEQFEEIVKLNMGQLSCKGQREFKIVGQSFSGSARWEQYTDGTLIEHLYGYECKDLIVYSYAITMWDVLNLLDHYIHNLPKHCRENENYEVKVDKDDTDYIKSIECESLRFKARRIGNRVVIELNIYEL